MDETTTRLLFHQVSADAPVPAVVDLGKIVRRAERKRRRHRRWAAAAAAVSVLVLTSAVALVATGADRTQPLARPVGPSQGPNLTTAPTAFDPLRNAIRVNWLPTELPYLTQGVSRTEASFTASHRDGEMEYWVRLAARGHTTDFDLEFTPKMGATSVEGPEINGEPSRWYSAGTKRRELRWQWAPGAEGRVTLDDQPDALDIAVRIAKSAHVTETALRLPYTVDLPPSYRALQNGFGTRREELRAYDMTFQDSATGSIIGIGTASNTMTLDFEPNTVISNRPGQTKQDGEFARLRIRQPTVQFEISCNDRPKTAGSVVAATKRCRAVAESITLVADPLDWEDWPEATVR
ncbi:hypothetical protein [Cryptosporangium minutisporangium]|uniref:Uncharacterized protein n=1 Tax=Cryptosporangium minutisporangium TaxID=113569 RepID=A0ABP6T2W1_9ACTN